MNMQPPDNEEMTAGDYVDMLYKKLAEYYEKLVAAEARVEKLTEFVATCSKSDGLMVNGNTLAMAASELLKPDNLSALREHDAQLLEKAYERLETHRPILNIGLIKIELDDMAAEIRADA